jgi:pyrroline-5-carboxylate reductase
VTAPLRLGVIGTGALGGAIARAALRAGVVTPATLLLANRSGRLEGFADWPDLQAVPDLRPLPRRCEMILLAVPPAALGNLRLEAEGLPVVSVMAAASVAALTGRTGTDRILRAMSSPAADLGLAHSPIFAAAAATPSDRDRAARLLGACGLVDFVEHEPQIDTFTALTGPVPGFVAFFARAVAERAVEAGIPPAIADRAVRQLFLASGTILAADARTPAAHVAEMIAYAGTTAAGLEMLEASDLARILDRALGAATARARTIAGTEGG